MTFMTAPLRVLMLTTAWPREGQPQTTHFVKRQVDYLRDAGVDVDVFVLRGGRRARNYLRAWREVRGRLAANPYDVVHAQFGQSGLLALPSPLPLVVTLRGSDILGIVGPGGRKLRLGRVLQALTRFVCRCADAVIVVSAHMQAELPADVAATVLPSGLDFELFRPMERDEARRHLGLPLDRHYVLFAGDPAQPRKRHHIAAESIRLASLEMSMEMLVAWGVPHTDMPYYMNACDAMVFTSMQEGSPNVVKEALACDLPVVSVEVGDVTERLAGIEGCEVTVDDSPATVAAALVRVLRRGGRVAGRETVLPLDERACTQRLIAIYRSLLHRAPAAHRARTLLPETTDA
jgi:teichuronic acid biosynthesis glycosyltransferase TuaC